MKKKMKKTQKCNFFLFQSDIRSPKTLNNHRLHNEFPMHLFNSEKPDKNITATVTKEEPTSTINHDENCAKSDLNMRSERSSSTDSYDENGIIC